MAGKSLAGGELYFIGEIDPYTKKETNFVKVGIVREKEGRFSDQRLKEHQTGNPRQLHIVEVIPTPIVERIETTMHGIFAPSRLSGEWFSFSQEARVSAISRAKELVAQAEQMNDAMSQVETLKKQVSEPNKLAQDDSFLAIHRSIIEFRVQAKVSGQLLTDLTRAMAEAKKLGIEFGNLLSVQKRKPTERFLEVEFKEKYEDLWDQYQIEKTQFSGVFRVTDPKATRPDPFELNTDLRDLSKQCEEALIQLKAKTIRAEDVHELYLQVLSVNAPLVWKKDLLEDEAKSMIGIAAGVEGLFDWSREFVTKMVLDSESLKRDHPEEYADCVEVRPAISAVVPAKDRGFQLPG